MWRRRTEGVCGGGAPWLEIFIRGRYYAARARLYMVLMMEWSEEEDDVGGAHCRSEVPAASVSFIFRGWNKPLALPTLLTAYTKPRNTYNLKQIIVKFPLLKMNNLIYY